MGCTQNGYSVQNCLYQISRASRSWPRSLHFRVDGHTNSFVCCSFSHCYWLTEDPKEVNLCNSGHGLMTTPEKDQFYVWIFYHREFQQLGWVGHGDMILFSFLTCVCSCVYMYIYVTTLIYHLHLSQHLPCLLPIHPPHSSSLPGITYPHIIHKYFNFFLS